MVTPSGFRQRLDCDAATCDAISLADGREGGLESPTAISRPLAENQRADNRVVLPAPGRTFRGNPPAPDPGAKPVAEQPNASAELQQKYRQFLDLLPLTISLAGLPTSEARLFSEEQIEARAMTIRAAYRVARATAKECLSGS
jgi:hypothetical protein